MLSEQLLKDLTKINSSFNEFSDVDEIIDWFRKNGFYISVIPTPSYAPLNKVAWSWTFNYNSDGSDWSYTDESRFIHLTYTNAAIDAITIVVDFYIQTLNIQENE